MQKHCVVARFDSATEDLILKWKAKAHSLQQTIYADKPWCPHLTISLYENVSITELCDWTDEYTESQLRMPLQFNSLGVFSHGKHLDTDVIFVNPCSSLELLDFYFGYHHKLDEYCGSSGVEYSTTYGSPVLHSTITICKKNDFNKVFDYLRDEFVAISGKIVALEIYELPMKFVKRYDLL